MAKAPLNELKRFFGNLPVVDAKENLRIFVNDDDVHGAKRRDPKNCVLARACCRLYGSNAVAFFRMTAYLLTSLMPISTISDS